MIDVPLLKGLRLRLASNWSQTFRFAGTPQKIQSSTNATPIVVTQQQHGYTNGESIVIFGHDNLAANGVWIVAGATTNTYQLTGSIGSAAGSGVGHSAPTIDSTGCTALFVLLASNTDTEPLFFFTNTNSFLTSSPVLKRYTFTGTAPRGSFAWIEQTSTRFSIGLDYTQIAASGVQMGDTLYAIGTLIDSLGVPKEYARAEIKVEPWE